MTITTHNIRARRDTSLSYKCWPLDAALRPGASHALSGATRVPVHHGSGVDYLLYAGIVVVPSGTPEATDTDDTLDRIQPGHPGRGVVRQADAGYRLAVRTAEHQGLRLPMHEEGEC
jgi:urocanate hydratase